tara:strand:- start:28 stop:201 length:174 start_codon:yes stop_codon:yes gene_type:complete
MERGAVWSSMERADEARACAMAQSLAVRSPACASDGTKATWVVVVPEPLNTMKAFKQ